MAEGSRPSLEQIPWLVMSEGFAFSNNPIGLRIKRVMDIALALLLSACGLAFDCFASLAILIESGRPGLVSANPHRSWRTAFSLFSSFAHAPRCGKTRGCLG